MSHYPISRELIPSQGKKELKFAELQHFKKKANEDQYRFNTKLSDVLTKAKSLCSSQELDKVKES